MGNQERVCVGHVGFEVLVRHPGDLQEDQTDGSGDPRGLQAGARALETAKGEMVPVPSKHLWEKS